MCIEPFASLTNPFHTPRLSTNATLRVRGHERVAGHHRTAGSALLAVLERGVIGVERRAAREIGAFIL
jgi:hypothetical protein